MTPHLAELQELRERQAIEEQIGPEPPAPTDEEALGLAGRARVRVVDGRFAPEGPPAKPLRELSVPLTVESLRADPPSREYLLRDQHGRGVLLRGRVGLLAARGGSGKTVTLVQLAVAVATGSPLWSAEGWHPEQGRALMLLAEEDAAEVRRRLHHAAKAARVDSDASLAQIVECVTVLPLCGQGVALTADREGESGGLPETARAEEVRELLREAAKEGAPYSLVILDPLSRFAGADAEKDNGLMTRLVQVIETFTAADCGLPAVLIAHHLRKTGRDDALDTADPIRGASALVDGVRWAAILEPRPRVEGAAELLRLRVVKSNYAAVPAPLTLCRPPDGHGCLRLATAEEVAAYEAAAPRRAPRRGDTTPEARIASARAAVLASLADGIPRTLADVRGVVRLGQSAVSGALHELLAEGEVERTAARRWRVPVDSRTQSTSPESTARTCTVDSSPLFKGDGVHESTGRGVSREVGP